MPDCRCRYYSSMPMPRHVKITIFQILMCAQFFPILLWPWSMNIGNKNKNSDTSDRCKAKKFGKSKDFLDILDKTATGRVHYHHRYLSWWPCHGSEHSAGHRFLHLLLLPSWKAEKLQAVDGLFGKMGGTSPYLGVRFGEALSPPPPASDFFFLCGGKAEKEPNENGGWVGCNCIMCCEKVAFIK